MWPGSKYVNVFAGTPYETKVDFGQCGGQCTSAGEFEAMEYLLCECDMCVVSVCICCICVCMMCVCVVCVCVCVCMECVCTPLGQVSLHVKPTSVQVIVKMNV